MCVCACVRVCVCVCVFVKKTKFAQLIQKVFPPSQTFSKEELDEGRERKRGCKNQIERQIKEEIEAYIGSE